MVSLHVLNLILYKCVKIYTFGPAYLYRSLMADTNNKRMMVFTCGFFFSTMLQYVIKSCAKSAFYSFRGRVLISATHGMVFYGRSSNANSRKKLSFLITILMTSSTSRGKKYLTSNFLYFLFFSFRLTRDRSLLYSVKPIKNDHPRGPKIVAVFNAVVVVQMPLMYKS